jgi:Fe-S-cluster-containing dehydrogenase component
MVIDLAKCTACQACVVACESENNVPCVSPGEAGRGRILSWIKILPELEGEYPRLSMRMMPLPCVHCDRPPCIEVCPVSATGIGPEGIVRQTFARCIGCRYCTTACPYTRRMFNFYAPEFPGDFREALNPDVSLRPKGVVEKCTLCHHRLIKAREEARAALAAGHPLTVAAREYMGMARAKIGALAPDGPAGPLEAIEWFHTMIFVKVHRAVSGRLHDEEIDPDWPSDADGSAKVALMGIDESLVAWTDLSSALPGKLTAVLPVIEHLDRLRGALEAAFPSARAFFRPGLDSPDEATATPSS